MGDSWNYSKSRLSNVINTIETHLDSNLNPNSKLIQLVILVPKFTRMPLFIEETNKSKFKGSLKTVIVQNEVPTLENYD